MKPGYCQLCDTLSDVLNFYSVKYNKLILGEDFSSEQFITKFGRGSGFPYVVDENGEEIKDIRKIIEFIKS
jgi:hypothetical protein